MTTTPKFKHNAASDRATRLRAAVRRSQTAWKRKGAKVTLAKIEFAKEQGE
jgi:hypothetical protein